MSDKTLNIKFDRHGLGDCVHFAYAVQLYRSRGYDVTVQVEENKKFLWQVSGVNVVQGGGLPDHSYHYPAGFENLNEMDCLTNKVAFGLRNNVMPSLGELGLTEQAAWDELCNVRLSAHEHIPQEAHDEAERFLEGLPRPIIAIHSRGTNWHERKSIPTEVAFDVILKLMEQTGGSVIVLDFDRRAPMVGDERCKGIKPSWGHISVDRLCALYERIDLMIGVDSGPFHVAAMTGVKALGVFRSLHPTRVCLPNPNAVYLVSEKHREQMQSRSDRWTTDFYQADEPTADEIVLSAVTMLQRPQPIIEGQIMNICKDSVVGKYTYRRVGHDERVMELLPDGKIGQGSADCERVWKLDQTSSGELLTIIGIHGGPTCHLSPSEDGVFRGRWLNFEKMPIELIPIKSGHPSDSRPDWHEEFYVGIPTLFRHDLLHACIESILSGSALPRVIYVIDNTDDTRMPAWVPHPSKRIRVIRPNHNMGVAKSWNVLHSLCQPKPLIITNDDIEVGHNLFEKMLEMQEPWVSGNSHQMCCVFLLRNSLWKEIGRFDEEFWPAYHEDNDYGYRMLLKGHFPKSPLSDGYKDSGPSATKAAFNDGEMRHFNNCFNNGRAYYVKKWGGPPHLETFKQPFGGENG